jgi:hypothetical protein
MAATVTQISSTNIALFEGNKTHLKMKVYVAGEYRKIRLEA